MITPLRRHLEKVISFGRPASLTKNESTAAFAALDRLGRGAGGWEPSVGF